MCLFNNASKVENLSRPYPDMWRDHPVPVAQPASEPEGG